MFQGIELPGVCPLVAFLASTMVCGDVGAQADKIEGLVTEKLPVRTGAGNGGGDPLFSSLAPAETGITFQNSLDISHPLKRLYQSGFACGGVAIGDLDGDSMPEIFFASGPGSNHLYRQTAPLQFEDIADAAGMGGGDDWAAGVVFADIDGDGDLDVYVCNYDSPNALFLNETISDGGSPRLAFREAAREFGLDLVDACLMPSFCDISS